MNKENLPPHTFDLIVWLDELKMKNIDLSWLIAKMDITDRRRLLEVRYKRDLASLGE